MQPFIGQVETFAFNRAPQGWLPCDGRLIAIEGALELFQLIGTTYGGDGTTNFALPKLGSVGPQGPKFFIALVGQFPR
jgi:microcystin-dependent protein